MKKLNLMVLAAISLILVTLPLAASTRAESTDDYLIRAISAFYLGQYDQAIADYTKAIEINPRDPRFYGVRAGAFYFKKEYDKAWEDVQKAQSLGLRDPKFQEFVDDLRRASGRER